MKEKYNVYIKGLNLQEIYETEFYTFLYDYS